MPGYVRPYIPKEVLPYTRSVMTVTVTAVRCFRLARDSSSATADDASCGEPPVTIWAICRT
jgi:hypothetical protein